VIVCDYNALSSQGIVLSGVISARLKYWIAQLPPAAQLTVSAPQSWPRWTMYS